MNAWATAEESVARALGGVWQELREVAAPGARGRHGLMVAAAVPLAVVMALALRLEFVWWAGITAFMTTMAGGTATVRRVVLRLVGGRSKLVFLPLPADDPRQRQPDIGLATEHLGWTPTVSLEDGLKETISYFRNLLEDDA